MYRVEIMGTSRTDIANTSTMQCECGQVFFNIERPQPARPQGEEFEEADP